MLLKYTLKNIFSRPGRLIVLLLCLTVACLAGYLAADFSGVLQEAIYGELTEKMGDVDYQLTSFASEGLTQEMFAGGPPVEFVGRAGVNKKEVIRTQRRYNYEITETVNFSSFTDFALARRLRLLNFDTEPGIGECAISQKYSEKYGYQIGDTIMVLNLDNDEVPLTVVQIYDTPKLLAEISAVISFEEYKILRSTDKVQGGYTDVAPENMKDFEQFMEKEHSNVICLKLSADDAFQKLLENIGSMLYLIFVLVFVLVIFVTISFTEKIITERMSVIGTLRSIGMSMRKTAFILLFENVIYGLVGSLIALVIYLCTRNMIFMLLTDSSTIGRNSGIPVVKCLVIIVLAVLIQILIPLKEVLKAVKTSIRDIIFDTRDSAYKVSGIKTAAGVVLIVCGLVSGFVAQNHWIVIVSVLLLILGAAMVVEFLVQKVTGCFAKIFARASMPVAELAARETGTKKPNSGNAVLAVAAITAAASIYVCAYSLLVSMNSIPYDTDVIITETPFKISKYEYLEEQPGVEDVTYICNETEDITVGGVKRSAVVWMLPDSKRYTALGELPTALADDEIILDRMTALKAGVNVGDAVEVVFHDMGVFPVPKQLRVAQITDQYELYIPCTVIVSPVLYKELFADYVNTVLVSTQDPAGLKTELEASLTHGETVKTYSEVKAEREKDMRTTNLGIIGVVLIAVILTLIGISGNQVIGFAGRKKEYAMLHACACGKRDIIKMIWIENIMLFGVSTVIAMIVLLPVTRMMARIFLLADIGLNLTLRYDTMLLCLVLLWVVTMLTALSPIRSLKKMNTAIEMKYE